MYRPIAVLRQEVRNLIIYPPDICIVPCTHVGLYDMLCLLQFLFSFFSPATKCHKFSFSNYDRSCFMHYCGNDLLWVRGQRPIVCTVMTYFGVVNFIDET